MAKGSLSCAQLLSFRAKDWAVGLLIVVGSGRGHKRCDDDPIARPMGAEAKAERAAAPAPADSKASDELFNKLKEKVAPPVALGDVSRRSRAMSRDVRRWRRARGVVGEWRGWWW